VIGGNIKNKFFSKENPIGQYIKFDKVWLKVVGVLEKNDVDLTRFENIGVNVMNDNIYVPVKTMLMRYQNRALVGSRIKGMKDVVAEGDNALLFEVGQVDQLADALFRLMINPEERQSFGRRSWVLAETNFSFSGVLEKLDRIYGSITEINLGKG